MSQVVELHDCFSANELITYEALGLCGEGEAGQFIDAGDNTYGGKYVVNPSGGLISKGHPLGATGLAQCYELCSQVSFTKVLFPVRGQRLDCCSVWRSHVCPCRCGARLRPGRCPGPAWRCSTTSGWAGPWWWRSTGWASPPRSRRRPPHSDNDRYNMQ